MTPLERLARHNDATGRAFGTLREAMPGTGSIDGQTCELVTLGALATTGEEDGGDAEAIAHAVLVPFGATTTFSRVGSALRRGDEVAAETNA